MFFVLPRGGTLTLRLFLTLPRKVTRTLMPSPCESRHQGERRARKCLRASYFAFSPLWNPLTCAVCLSETLVSIACVENTKGFLFEEQKIVCVVDRNGVKLNPNTPFLCYTLEFRRNSQSWAGEVAIWYSISRRGVSDLPRFPKVQKKAT